MKRGSQSIPITFWQVLFRLKENGRRISADEASNLPDRKTTRSAVLRYYRVFNIDDTKGIEVELPSDQLLTGTELIVSCERILAEMPNPPKIGHHGGEAYYYPAKDYLNMPKLRFFRRAELYYSVLFHELIHSTGHSSRLNRVEIQETAAFGSHTYSQEELTAEIGASFLNCQAGILNTLTFEDSAAYIQGWLQKLRNDKKFIFLAAAKAQKAVDYILNK